MTTEATTAPGRTAAAPQKKPKVSDRTKSERKLAWMLCAPAVIAMLLVTAYPILYAIVLSVQKLDLRFPDEGGFVGLDNYPTVLGSPLWWESVFNTVFITVVSVAIELVLGMIIALVMFRAIFARGLVRTTVLIPYGIITVVAAFAWFYAFDPGSGFVNHLPFVPDDKAWFGDRWSALGGDHRRRGLEDDTVHRPAAARRSDDDRRAVSTRRRRSTGRAPGSASGRSPCR